MYCWMLATAAHRIRVSLYGTSRHSLNVEHKDDAVWTGAFQFCGRVERLCA